MNGLKTLVDSKDSKNDPKGPTGPTGPLGPTSSKESLNGLGVDQVLEWEQSFTNWKSATPVIQALKRVDLNLEHEFEILLRGWLESKSKDLQSKIHVEASAQVGMFDPSDGLTKEEFRLLCDDIEMENASSHDQYEYAHRFEKKDVAKFVYWLEKSAKKGYSNAQNNLGHCYKNGSAVAKNAELAVKYFTLAAAQNNFYAQYNLGTCYENGIGIEKDHQLAIKYYTFAANQGFSSAQNDLGILYEEEEKYELAFNMYALAAKQSNPSGQHNVGRCYSFGYKVAKDDRLALHYYTLAAQQKLAVAQFNLGVCYETGFGTEINKQLAIKWYTLARDHGYSEATQKLDLLNCRPKT